MICAYCLYYKIKNKIHVSFIEQHNDIAIYSLLLFILFTIVCLAINSKVKNISFPDNPCDLREIKNRFHAIARIPNCVGAVDGTLIPIKGMSGLEEPAYVCRKSFHALNIQAVSDARMRFEFYP